MANAIQDVTLYMIKTGKAYTYHIKVMDSNSQIIACSDNINVITQLAGEVELIFTKNNKDQYELNWTKVEGATRYIVYRSTKGGTYRLMKRTKSLTCETTIKTGTSYTYKMRGFKLVNDMIDKEKMYRYH